MAADTRLIYPSYPGGRIIGAVSGTNYQADKAGRVTVAESDAPTLLADGWVRDEAIPSGSTTVAADVLAIPVTHRVVVKTTGSDAEALTLANGQAGQRLTIVLGTDGGGDGTLTPTTKTGFVAIVFADAGDQVTLEYVNDTVGWILVGYAGASAPPVVSLS